MNCHSDGLNAGLCEIFVELGKRFGLKTVAEGIETMHEMHKLQGIGVDVGQGYLFAKPMPKCQLIGLMRQRFKGELRPRPAAPCSAPRAPDPRRPPASRDLPVRARLSYLWRAI